MDGLPPKAQFGQRARTKVLGHNIGSTDEIPESLYVPVRLEIENDTLLTVVGTQVVRALPVGKRRSPLSHIIAPGRLDLDNLCPQVGQGHRTKGTTEHTRQVDDADSM